MKHTLRHLPAVLVLLLGSRLSAQTFDCCIHDVSVIRPELEHPIATHQDVYIKAGNIVKISSASKVSPKHCLHIVEGTGKFVMAGLTDMHVHLPSDHFDQFCWLNLAAGVTTVRSMRGKPEHLELRKHIVARDLIGPDMILATPYFPNKDIKQADLLDTMKAFAREGYDCVKVLAVPDSAYFEALMFAANAVHIPVVGHWPWQVPIERVIEAGYNCIEHLDGLEQAYKTDTNSVPRLAQLLKQHHTWICPTLDYYAVVFSQVPQESLRRRAGLDLLNASTVERWDSIVTARFAMASKGPADSVALKQAKTRAYIDRRYALVKKLSDRGVNFILSPAEANDPYGVPGFCVWEEMRLLSRCGISNQMILKMATYNAAWYMKQTKHWGSIGVGLRANLVLFNKDPLESIENITDQDGVFLHGEYIAAERLRSACLSVR